MNIDDIVLKNYGGLQRYGKVEEVKENFKGDGWKWVKVGWVDDEQFIKSQQWKAQLRGEKTSYFIPKYYRCDDIQKIDLNKTLQTLVKLQ